MWTIEAKFSGRVPELPELNKASSNEKYYITATQQTKKKVDVQKSKMASKASPEL